MDLTGLDIDTIVQIRNQCDVIIRDTLKQLTTELKKEYADDEYCVRRDMSNTIVIKNKTHYKPLVTIGYYHLHKTNGGECDGDGDLISTFPYYIESNDSCNNCSSHNAKRAKCNTIEEVISFLTITPTIEDGVRKLLSAIEQREHLERATGMR